MLFIYSLCDYANLYFFFVSGMYTSPQTKQLISDNTIDVSEFN